MSVSWYDVLGVAPAATEDEIRTAWRAATSDLEPTDRRFDLYNQAAKVLLDPEARADYDRAQGAEAASSEAESASPEVEPVETAEETLEAEPASPEVEPVETGTESQKPGLRSRLRAGVPAWLLAGLALAVLVVGGVAGYLHLADDADADDGARVHEAQAVLEDSFGDLLTYRYDDLESAHQRAVALLTPRYRCEFDRVWSLVEDQAEKVETVVKTDVVRSGVTRVSEAGDRVELVALIRNEVTNKGGDQGVGTLLLGVTMVADDRGWLVDEVDGLEGGEQADGGDPCAEDAPSSPAS